MEKRDLGATGIKVGALALGTWGLSGEGYGPVAEKEQDAVIERAVAFGVTLFETADSYAAGRRLKRTLAGAAIALLGPRLSVFRAPARRTRRSR